MNWAATQAKAKFSEVLDRAEVEGPQIVSRRKREFVVLTKEQYQAGTRSRGEEKKLFVSAWDALKPSFRERYDVEFPRLKGKLRKVDLG